MPSVTTTGEADVEARWYAGWQGCRRRAIVERRRVLAVLVMLVPLVSCSLAPTPSPHRLPTLASDNGGCRDIGLSGAELAGSPEDPRVAWLDLDGGGRREIVWPPGFTARFTPQLEVLDAAGSIVFRAGDSISGGCTAGPADNPAALLVIRPGY